MKALVDPRAGRICELREEEFPVAAPLFWRDAPADVTSTWRFVGGEFLPPSGLDASALLDYCRQKCADKLAVGFPFDFGDARGVHQIGTTERDLKGWDEVRALAAAYRENGQAAAEITIATDTGAAVITAAEWPPIDIAAGAFRQPIWAASFAVQAKILQGIITDYAGVDNAADWP